MTTDGTSAPPAAPEAAGAAGAPAAGAAGAPKPARKYRYQPRRKVCQFCVDKVQFIDYKDSGRLRRYISDRGKLDARRKTGTCARHQRMLTAAIKRARHMALMPYTAAHIRASGGVGARG